MIYIQRTKSRRKIVTDLALFPDRLNGNIRGGGLVGVKTDLRLFSCLVDFSLSSVSGLVHERRKETRGGDVLEEKWKLHIITSGAGREQVSLASKFPTSDRLKRRIAFSFLFASIRKFQRHRKHLICFPFGLPRPMRQD